MSDSGPQLDSRTRRWAYAIVIATAVGATTANVFTARPLQSANDRSRWCTVESLLEHGTYVIDEIDADPRWTTIDKVRHEGRFYSTKPPLLPTLVAGVTWGVERAGGLDLRDDTRDVVPWVLVFVNVLPLTLALVALAWFVERYATSDFTRLFVVTTAAFGTLLTPFATTLNNHSVAACAVMLCLAVAARILLDEDDTAATGSARASGQRSMWPFAACGFLAMFTCTNELPAAAFGVAIFVLLHLRDARRTWLTFVPAALVPLVAYLALNFVVTGGPKPFYAYYGTEKYEYVHEGVPSYWMNPTGIDTNRDTPAVYLLHCLVGHHGILSLSPVFLLAAVSWLRLAWWRGERLATFCWLGALLTAIVLGFYLSRTSNYNYGGISAGLRWTIWLIPFWLIATIPTLDRLPGRGLRALAVTALGLSVFSAWHNARTPWEQPWLFDAMERAGWIDYSDPTPELDAPLWTWFGSIPDPTDGPRSITFVSHGIAGEERLQLTALDTAADGRVRVRVERTNSADPAESFAFTIDPDSLRRTGLEEVTLDGDADPSLLRGLPTAFAFEATGIAYVHTPLRTDAYRTTKAIAHVDYRPTADDPYRRFYCETWLTDDVPFGCVRFETTITDPTTGEILAKRVWVAAKTSP